MILPERRNILLLHWVYGILSIWVRELFEVSWSKTYFNGWLSQAGRVKNGVTVVSVLAFTGNTIMGQLLG